MGRGAIYPLVGTLAGALLFFAAWKKLKSKHNPPPALPYLRDRHHRTRFRSTGAGRTWCCATRPKLRSVIPNFIQHGDKVLVVGLDPEVIAEIAQYVGGAGEVVAIDMGRAGYGSYLDQNSHSAANSLPGKHQAVRLFTADAWDLPFLVSLDTGFTVVVADVMGLQGRDGLLDTVSLLQQYWRCFPLRAILVKSRALLEIGLSFVDARHIVGVFNATQQIQSTEMWNGAAGKVVCSVGVHEYRQTIPAVVQPGDTVLEIGCQRGITTRLARQHQLKLQQASGLPNSGKVIGLDLGTDSIKAAQQHRRPSSLGYSSLLETHGILQDLHGCLLMLVAFAFSLLICLEFQDGIACLKHWHWWRPTAASLHHTCAQLS
eukprot:TRINITY_DN3802_c0_g1_i1.p1 TRINITY_DN3802_c0_g1~~TRINITY_DN3802_c0_g1_i1.p1  ORF type:complete len:384 (-),score=29.76 TRINITY_DN3802_c0_g1_i1:129-1250(-)